MTGEPRETRLKRLRIRAWRRGIKEMDLVLGGFADARLSDLSDAEIDIFEALMGENDHDLLQWVTEQSSAPARYQDLLPELRKHVAQER